MREPLEVGHVLALTFAMMVSNRISVFGLLGWQWRSALLFTVAATAAQLLHIGPKWTHLTIPAMPLGVVGGAIGIFVSFRTNSCYARWWEGRQLWGRLVNLSRTFASQALTAFEGDIARELVRRQYAYAHLLRCSLRDQSPWDDADVIASTTAAERESLRADKNPCFALMHLQREALTRRVAAGELSEFRLQSFDATIAGVIDAQGGCERIKRTPFPRGYGVVSQWLILAYGCILPFGIVKDLGWATIPLSLLACMSFLLIGETGRVLEDPFNLFWNALPLSALTRTIEVNLRQRLGDRDVPPLLTPDEKGILM